MWKYSILISYVGTHYCGWQKQTLKTPTKIAPSIQITLENALFKMTGEAASVVGSGRTDSGVHAIGQVAHFILRNKPWPAHIIQRGLNGLLPPEIRILSAQPVLIEFHAQKSALKKQYSYYYQQGTSPLPFCDPLSWWIRKPLDLAAMNIALQTLIGEHDFKPFQGSRAKPGPTRRTILEAEVSSVPIGFPTHTSNPTFYESFFFVRVRVLGTGFLKQMVRGIAGTLLQVGENRRPASCMHEILATQQRSLVGPTAPAKGLWLEQVWYPENHSILWKS